MKRDEGIKIIQRAVAASFQLSVNDVEPGQSLVNDLGADSLDFVDLLFTLEEQFDVEFSDGETSFLSRLDITSPDMVQDGFLTAQAVTGLQEWLPAISTLDDPSKITPARLFSLVTVETLWVMVQKAKPVEDDL